MERLEGVPAWRYANGLWVLGSTAVGILVVVALVAGSGSLYDAVVKLLALAIVVGGVVVGIAIAIASNALDGE